MQRIRHIAIESAPSLKGAVLTFLDLETNGLERTTPILELAALRASAEELSRGMCAGEEFHSFIRFAGAINPAAYSVHKIDSQILLEKGRDLPDVLKDFSRFARGTILVGHNISYFDLPILNHHCTQHGIPLQCAGMLDTCLMARERLLLPSYRLSALAEYFGVENRPSHRALNDVRATAEVFCGLMEGQW